MHVLACKRMCVVGLRGLVPALGLGQRVSPRVPLLACAGLHAVLCCCIPTCVSSHCVSRWPLLGIVTCFWLHRGPESFAYDKFHKKKEKLQFWLEMRSFESHWPAGQDLLMDSGKRKKKTEESKP